MRQKIYLKSLSLGKSRHHYLYSKPFAFDRHLYDVRVTAHPLFLPVVCLGFFPPPLWLCLVGGEDLGVFSQFSNNSQPSQTRGFSWVWGSLLHLKKWLLQVYELTWLHRIVWLWNATWYCIRILVVITDIHCQHFQLVWPAQSLQGWADLFGNFIV